MYLPGKNTGNVFKRKPEKPNNTSPNQSQGHRASNIYTNCQGRNSFEVLPAWHRVNSSSCTSFVPELGLELAQVALHWIAPSPGICKNVEKSQTALRLERPHGCVWILQHLLFYCLKALVLQSRSCVTHTARGERGQDGTAGGSAGCTWTWTFEQPL